MKKIKEWVQYYKDNRSAINFWYALGASVIGLIIGSAVIVSLSALLIAVEAFIRADIDGDKSNSAKKGVDNA